MTRLRIALVCVAGLFAATAASAHSGMNGMKQYGLHPSMKDFRVTEFHQSYAFRNFAAQRLGHARALLNSSAKEVGSVPEPGTWAMLLIGLGLVSLKLRSHQPKKLPSTFAGAM